MGMMDAGVFIVSIYVPRFLIYMHSGLLSSSCHCSCTTAFERVETDEGDEANHQLDQLRHQNVAEMQKSIPSPDASIAKCAE